MEAGFYFDCGLICLFQLCKMIEWISFTNVAAVAYVGLFTVIMLAY